MPSGSGRTRGRRTRARARVALCREFEHGPGRRVVATIEAEHVLQRQVVGRPGVEIFRDGKTCASRLAQRNLEFERREHSRADVRADAMHIIYRRSKAIRPDDARVARVHELDRDRQLPADQFHRACQQVRHAEQSADVACVCIGRHLHSKRRRPRRDEQPAQAREFGDQVVRQGLGERLIGSGVT